MTLSQDEKNRKFIEALKELTPEQQLMVIRGEQHRRRMLKLEALAAKRREKEAGDKT